MKEHPILFSAPMVRAILNGTKTQTRRAVKYNICGPSEPMDTWDWYNKKGLWVGAHGRGYPFAKTNAALLSPYGKPGDRLTRYHCNHEQKLIGTEANISVDSRHRVGGDHLYVRETWAASHAYDHLPPRLIPKDARIHYSASEDRGGLLWRPSIHMPRWASRITLAVTGVRVERLQDISEADALAEGVNVHPDHHGKPRTSIYSPVQAYRDLWESINGPGSWDANPFVWVVTFERMGGA